MKKTHLFFDMDGTVTPSRRKVSPEMKDLLQRCIDSGLTIAIISGSHNQQMTYQMDGLSIIKMGQNGNHTIDSNGLELWFDKLTDDEKNEIMHHAHAIWSRCTHQVPDESDLFEDRGSQISLSIYGHHADPEEKKNFDGDFKKRIALLAELPFTSSALEVKLGGSTCLDYFKKGRNKGFNINRIIVEKGWNKNECLFYGDALFPGGNDETVQGVIETIAVTDPEETYQKLSLLLQNNFS
jgi:phosphomannomutase